MGAPAAGTHAPASDRLFAAPSPPGGALWERPDLDPKVANRLYHDAAAGGYDAAWAISFDRRCIRYVSDLAGAMISKRRYERVLDVGCGTGFFLLNLWQAGYVGEPHGCDLSPGMLAVCARSARTIGCDVRLRTADAEQLPYLDRSFDLVVVHAVLHHVPDPLLALREAHRVLAPGGVLFVAGEPTRLGDRLARATGRATWAALGALSRLAPALRRSKEQPVTEDEQVLGALEWRVDLHTFDPEGLAALAWAAGFRRVRVATDELLSSVVGWAVRTVEASVEPRLVGPRWARAAYRAYLALSALDRSVLARVVPPAVFHNVLLAGERSTATGTIDV